MYSLTACRQHYKSPRDDPLHPKSRFIESRSSALVLPPQSPKRSINLATPCNDWHGRSGKVILSNRQAPTSGVIGLRVGRKKLIQCCVLR